MPSKTWLADEGLVKVLARATTALHGEEIGERENIFDQLKPRLRGMLQNSLLQNSQAEEFLVTVLGEAIRNGKGLQNLSLETYGGKPAAKYIDRLQQAEGLLMMDYVFERRPGNAIGLTPAGTEYLRNLIDPEYPFWVKGDDDVYAVEVKARMRGNY